MSSSRTGILSLIRFNSGQDFGLGLGNNVQGKSKTRSERSIGSTKFAHIGKFKKYKYLSSHTSSRPLLGGKIP